MYLKNSELVGPPQNTNPSGDEAATTDNYNFPLSPTGHVASW